MPLTTYTAGEVLTASSLNSNLTAAGGLQFIKSQTIGTGVSSVAVTAAFSTTYDNYKILISGGVGSTDIGISLQLGSTTTGYYVAWGGATFAGVTDSSGFANTTNFPNMGYATTANQYGTIELQNPFLARNTNAQWNWAATVTAGRARAHAGYLNDTTSYTGFTLLLTSGTLTGGTISIYGYAK